MNPFLNAATGSARAPGCRRPGCDPRATTHGQPGDPADGCSRSHSVWPAAHRGRQSVELRGDPPIPGTGGAGLQRSPDPGGGVRPPRRHQRGQQHVRGPAGRAAGPPRSQDQGGGAAVAHGALRACPQGCSGPAQPGQRSVPAARSVSARTGSAIPIIAARWGHGARAWPTTAAAGRGQLMWDRSRTAPERGGGGRDGRARHDDAHRRPSLGHDAGERSFVVALSSQMNAPAAGRSSSPSTAPNGRHVVIPRIAQHSSPDG